MDDDLINLLDGVGDGEFKLSRFLCVYDMFVVFFLCVNGWINYVWMFLILDEEFELMNDRLWLVYIGYELWW